MGGTGNEKRGSVEKQAGKRENMLQMPTAKEFLRELG